MSGVLCHNNTVNLGVFRTEATGRDDAEAFDLEWSAAVSTVPPGG